MLVVVGWTELRNVFGDILYGAAYGRYQHEMRKESLALNDLFKTRPVRRGLRYCISGGAPLDQHVALREEGHEHVADHSLGRLDGPPDVVPEPRSELCYRGRIELRDGRHAPPW